MLYVRLNPKTRCMLSPDRRRTGWLILERTIVVLTSLHTTPVFPFHDGSGRLRRSERSAVRYTGRASRQKRARALVLSPAVPPLRYRCGSIEAHSQTLSAS